MKLLRSRCQGGDLPVQYGGPGGALGEMRVRLRAQVFLLALLVMARVEPVLECWAGWQVWAVVVAGAGWNWWWVSRVGQLLPPE